MAPLRLIDTHVHFWDPRRLNYAWLQGDALLNRPYEARDYPARERGLATDALVFVECDADPGQSLEEIRFVEEQARADHRIRAIVAHAPLELGVAVEPLLEQIVARSSRVRGIRRILQGEPDVGAVLRSAAFIEGARLLSRFGLHFEITVNYTQMDAVIEFVRTVPQLPMVLDHCGKPGIRHDQLDLFRRHATELARHPNILCKLSGLATEAQHDSWTEAQLLPYIDTALQAFGPERLLYGSDWPVCLLAISPARWLEVLERALQGCSPGERQQIFHDNAVKLYRLDLT
jgi:L-fuconolactonase